MINLSFKEKLFLKYLGWKLRPSRLNRFLHQVAPFSPSEHYSKEKQEAQADKVVVSAVQQEFKLCEDVTSFAGEIHRPVREAAAQGSSLVVFPEYNALMLLGMLPGIEKLSYPSNTPVNNKIPADQGFSEHELPVREIMTQTGPLLQKALMQVFSHMAAAYNLFIMAGTLIVPYGKKVFNRSYLFSPGGELLGTQDKIHLFPTERQWGLNCGNRLHVFQTCLGNLCMPICMDATYFETFRILKLLGGEIAMLPIANAEPYNYYLSMRGLWPRVQESLLYGIKSALVGQFLSFTFTGKAEIFAPLELTPEKDGVLAETKYPHGYDLVTATLDRPSLHELRRNHPYMEDINRELYMRYLPQLYTTRNYKSSQYKNSCYT